MKNKVVLITGSSIGIGREAAYWFAKEGYKIVVTYYKDKEEAENTRKKCVDLGAKEVIVVYLDVSDDKTIKDCVKIVTDNFKHISVLINNAGVAVWNSLEKQSYKEIEDQVRVNLEGLIKLTKAFLPHTKEKIINISSGAGKTGFSDLTVYCATKFGVRGFTQALARETDLKVYSVNPGTTATRMTNFSGVSADKVGKIIFDVAEDKYDLDPGSDVDVWKMI